MNRDEVSKKTADVGGSHGSTRDCVGGRVAADPGGEDIKTRSEDVDAFAVVGEVGTLIAEGGSTDSNCEFSGGRGVVAGVLVVAAIPC